MGDLRDHRNATSKQTYNWPVITESRNRLKWGGAICVVERKIDFSS